MIKTIKLIFIIGLLGMMISCSGTNTSTNKPSSTTENDTTENMTTSSELTTEIPSTTESTQTTIQVTTNPTTEIPTTIYTTTEATTTQASTTEIPTTQTPTTTEAPTIEMVTIYFENVSSATFTYHTLSSVPGNDFTMPPEPTWPGYIFEGWYIDQELTIPFTITVYPDEDMTVYAKWTEEANPADQIMAALESDFDFVCDNNICVYEQYSWLTYTFNFNDLTFKKELIDDDASDSQTKNEVVIIDEDWNVNYSFSIQYLSNTASMTVSGDGSTDTYSLDSFSSNPSSYLTQSNVYDDAIDFINDAVVFLEIIVENLEIDYNNLN